MKLCLQIVIYLSVSTAAQQHKWVILDSETRLPVPWATVKMLHAKGGTIANEAGEWEGQGKARDTLWITAVGYRDTLLPVAQLCDTILLSRDIRLLADVEIRSRKQVAKVRL